MQFFLDIDGVLLNFEGAFVRFLNRTYGMDLPERYETGSWFFDDLLTREEMYERWQAFLDSRDSGQMEALVAPARFNALTAGNPVHLLTNFPEPYMEKREANLAALGFRYDSLHFCGLHAYRDKVPPSKGEIVAELRDPERPGFFIDDHPDNCLDVLERCRDVEVWVMSRFFNREFTHPKVRRAADWPSLFARLAPNGSPG
ncbi:MAG: hypothetical protein O7A08_03895 [SAR324 cluster bacterium]|nr:hypothetical protein [SAR324 cluster bacterium]MCZ6646584.1 hypothetical protein [SAR324 cluster bacterium]